MTDDSQCEDTVHGNPDVQDGTALVYCDTNADTNQLLEWPRCAKDCTADGLDDTCMRMCHGLCCCASAAAC